jgi:predicted TIM-barrel fold metal-dependent hydrolase
VSDGQFPRAAAAVVVDADGHVMEPPAAWEEAPEAMRPRIERDAAGYEHVVVGDEEILVAPLGTLGTPGGRFDDPSTFRRLEEALPGGFDPLQRLIDMDADGIDQAVMYPSVGLYLWALRDAAAAAALCRSYNNWLASWCDAAPERLFGAAALPLQDPPSALSELRRVSTELGFKTAFVRPNPCGGRGGRTLVHEDYEPLWAAAEELEITIGIHEGSSVTIPTLGSDRPFNPLVLHAVSHSFEQMHAYASLAAFGVLERHPRLRLVFLESGGGWLPFWLERLDEQAECFGGFCPHMKMKPSEYFRRQCFISYEADEQTLPLLAPLIGTDRIVWGSDYPHHDAEFPGVVLSLRRNLCGLGPAERQAILGANAAAAYGLPRIEPGPAAVASAYFGAVSCRDGEQMRWLFGPGAELVVGGSILRGPEEITSFYEQGAFRVADLLPRPGPMRVVNDGTVASRVEVDVEVRLAGRWQRLHDTFRVEHGLISRLEIA